MGLVKHAAGAAGLIVTALLAAACGTSHASTTAPPASPAATAAPAAAPPAQPGTAAGAAAAASTLFELYAAGQYPAVYADLAPAIRNAVPETTWVAVHQQCFGTRGVAYQVTSPVLSGPSTAVVTVSLAGAASSIGSETQTFDYVGGRWLWAPSGTDMSAAGNYSGTVSQIVARLTAAGYCGS